MGRIARGWSLAKQSLRVVAADASLTWLVVLGGIAAGAVALSLFLPAAVLYADERTWAAIALFVAGTYCSTFVGVYAAVAIAACAADVLDGKDATVGGGFAVARSRLPQIALWALVLTTVNLVLQALRDRGGIVGRVFAGGLAVAWGLATFLVVPILALEGLKPLEALTRSGELFRQRWGEQLTGTLSIGGLLFLAGIVPAAAFVLIAIGVETPTLSIVFVVLAVLSVVVAGVVASAARAVFAVALYRFSAGHGGTGPFALAELESAVTQKT